MALDTSLSTCAFVSEVGTDLREVMYDVDKRVAGGCVAIACPSGRRNVMAGAVCVKTVG